MRRAPRAGGPSPELSPKRSSPVAHCCAAGRSVQARDESPAPRAPGRAGFGHGERHRRRRASCWSPLQAPRQGRVAACLGRNAAPLETQRGDVPLGARRYSPITCRFQRRGRGTLRDGLDEDRNGRRDRNRDALLAKRPVSTSPRCRRPTRGKGSSKRSAHQTRGASPQMGGSERGRTRRPTAQPTLTAWLRRRDPLGFSRACRRRDEAGSRV
jgi:hypothetical protein